MRQLVKERGGEISMNIRKNVFKVLSIYLVMSVLVCNYTCAHSLPEMKPFVQEESDRQIKQPPHSNWCVRACVDVALSYLQELQKKRIITDTKEIVPQAMPAVPQNPDLLKITMAFGEIGNEMRRFSNNNTQITYERRTVSRKRQAGSLTQAEAYRMIYDALNCAEQQQPGRGIAILHFQSRNKIKGKYVQHACITYGLQEDLIGVYDPEPTRTKFYVNEQFFGYSVNGQPRDLVEFWLIRW